MIARFFHIDTPGTYEIQVLTGEHTLLPAGFTPMKASINIVLRESTDHDNDELAKMYKMCWSAMHDIHSSPELSINRLIVSTHPLAMPYLNRIIHELPEFDLGSTKVVISSILLQEDEKYIISLIDACGKKERGPHLARMARDPLNEYMKTSRCSPEVRKAIVKFLD
jgi:hypothetical protein